MHKRMSVKELETALKENRLMYEWDYARDRHFEKHAFNDIVTMQDARAFLKELDADNIAHTRDDVFRWGCTKAIIIRSWLKKPNWKTTTMIRAAFANNRRTTCSCHETGSYATLNDIFRKTGVGRLYP